MPDHDRLFKTLIKSFFGDFVTLVVPEQAAGLRLERAQFLDKESFTDVPGGRRAELDLVAQVPGRRGPSFVLVHVEIESAFRRAKEERLWRYYMHLRLAHRRPVLPILLALRGGPAGVERRSVVDRLGEAEVARFTYWVFGLSRSRAADWVDRPQPLAAALAALMRPQEHDRAEQKLRCLATIGRAGLDEAREFLLVDLVETYLKLNDVDQYRYAQKLERAGPEVRAMQTWAEKLESKYRTLGRREGRREGRQEGARSVLKRLLERRFGRIPAGTALSLEQLDLGQLETLTDRALEANTLAELGLGD